MKNSRRREEAISDMKRTFAIFLCLLLIACQHYDYRDASAPVEKRVDDLLSRMTLEEKVGQMNQFCGIEHVLATEELRRRKTGNYNVDAYSFYKNFNTDSICAWTAKGLIGSFLHVHNAVEADSLQALAMGSRLGIPLVFGIDAMHGNAFCIDNTVYPTAIGLAGTFDRALARKIARQTALEMRASGMHWTFGPGVDLSRDPRWGRCGETFGEDPYLVGEMAAETVKGYNGDGDRSSAVLSTIKHLVGGGQSVNGANGASSEIPEIQLRQLFFPPYEKCIQAGASAIMPAHNDINGIPCHTNKWLLNDVARGEWGFDGFYISDWLDLERLPERHGTAADYKDAFRQGLEAGIDMHMHGQNWTELVCELVREGTVSEKRIDASVRRILKAKFELGLFEHPYSGDFPDTRLCEEHRATALDAARESIALLKNDGILPLERGRYRNVLVTGVNADSMNILGDWSYPQKRENYVTILQGLREADPDCNFRYVDVGYTPKDMGDQDITEAVRMAQSCDAVIAVVGDFMLRDTPGQTGGENVDRADVRLPGRQREFIQRLASPGKPLILVIVSCRPLALRNENALASALLYAWEPGMYGGTAVAEIIYGDVNPSGRLPMTMPSDPGQSVMTYNYKPMLMLHPFVDVGSRPLYEFGYGLSYTSFEYSDPELSSPSITTDGTVTLSVKVRNTGNLAGDEVVQLYVRDLLASVTRPVKELKNFERVHLMPGEEKTVSFDVGPESLAFVGADMKWTVEPGDFELQVGGSSRDVDLKKVVLHVENR